MTTNWQKTPKMTQNSRVPSGSVTDLHLEKLQSPSWFLIIILFYYIKQFNDKYMIWISIFWHSWKYEHKVWCAVFMWSLSGNTWMAFFNLERNGFTYYLSPVKRICVFEYSFMTNFNCACPAIQRGQGSGFLSEGSSWFTACMSEQRRFWQDCADAQAGLNLRCSLRL